MSRTLTTQVDTALKQPNVPMLMLIEMDFASGIVRFCNASYNFVYSGNTYLGAGRAASVKNIEEGADQRMYGIELSLSGVDTALVAIALAESYQQRPITCRFAPLDANYQILPTPPIVWKGRMDRMDIEMGDTATITLTAESRLTDWNKADSRRYNDEDQKIYFPTDKGFEYVAQMVEKPVNWGVPIPWVETYAVYSTDRYKTTFLENRQRSHSSGGRA